ncbi:MAG: hypothetical protein M0Q38_09935 [Bacteroidales bacterium]|jgi:hypothetical protein|nr:hypothetical protein [Bacteroidales bacterium]
MKILVPQCLDIGKILQENPPVFSYHKDHFLYILHQITEIPANDKHVINNEGFVPIKVRYLQNCFRNYKLYLTYLIQYRILETDNHFIIGKKSKGYRFSEKYRDINKQVEIINHREYTQTNKNRVKKSKKAATRYPWLYKGFNTKLNIDFTAAVAYLQSNLQQDLTHENPKAYLKYNASFYAATKIKDHDFFFSIDDKGGRLYTNLTQFKKELRNFVEYDGKRLVSIDISNSQPFVSTLVLGLKFYTNSEITEATPNNQQINYKNIKREYSNKLPIEEITNIITIQPNEETIDNTDIPDVILYRQKVVEGQLYEYIAEEIKKRTGREIIRKEIKDIIYTVLFSDNRFIGQKKAIYKRIFRDIFPTVYKIFCLIKKHGGNTLAIILQGIEAIFMLDIISTRIARENPDMTMFTIHDSIVCEVGWEDYVSGIIREEAQKCFGFSPHLKIEYWRQKAE